MDEVLLRRARQPLVRFYRWIRPAISIGYFGRIREIEAAWPGFQIVRRWTGGGAVLHRDDITYSLAVPRESPMFQLASSEVYRLVHGVIAQVIGGRLGGVPVAKSGLPRPAAGCFENPVAGDVLVDGAKVAGAALRRTQWGLLHQGSIQSGAWRDETVEALLRAFGSTVRTEAFSPGDQALAEQIERERYGSETWLRRF